MASDTPKIRPENGEKARRNTSSNGNRGQFKPGNPGKPAGARHRATMAVEELMKGQASKLTQKCIKAALDGDMTAMRLCMERIAPPRKGRPTPFPLPTIKAPSDIMKGVTAILAAVADGTLSPDEAQAIMAVLEGSRRAFETTELAARLEALEAKTGGTR